MTQHGFKTQLIRHGLSPNRVQLGLSPPFKSELAESHYKGLLCKVYGAQG